ncbi:MAG: hypothetical protein KDD58_12155 [Bdellovibrionales bacterium]|nr:hypothetical protein [Bdellovibrionales bacterium]
MELFYLLLVLLFFTRAFGVLADKFNQPQLAGKFIAGVFLGVIFKNYTNELPQISSLTKWSALV